MSDPSKLRKFPDPDIPNAGKTLDDLKANTGTGSSPGTILGAVFGEGIEPDARAYMEALLQDTCAVADALEHSIQEITKEPGGLEKLQSMLYDTLAGRPSPESLSGDDDES